MIVGLTIGTASAYIAIGDQEDQANFCKDIEQEIQQNETAEGEEVRCHQPGVIQIEELEDIDRAELECVCRVKDQNNDVTIQPIYRSR